MSVARTCCGGTEPIAGFTEVIVIVECAVTAHLNYKRCVVVDRIKRGRSNKYLSELNRQEIKKGKSASTKPSRNLKVKSYGRRMRTANSADVRALLTR